MREDEAAALLQDFAQYLDAEIAGPAVARITTAIEAERQGPEEKQRERIAEYIRDASVLVLIFVPIDLLIPRLLEKNSPLALWLNVPEHIFLFAAGVVLLSFAMLRWSIALERSNK
jgi:hypothetical protein